MDDSINFDLTIDQDEDGFLLYGDFRLPIRYDADREVLEFFDKDRRRSHQRGTPFVEMPLEKLFQLRD